MGEYPSRLLTEGAAWAGRLHLDMPKTTRSGVLCFRKELSA
jgi:hypothetical protein